MHRGGTLGRYRRRRLLPQPQTTSRCTRVAEVRLRVVARESILQARLVPRCLLCPKMKFDLFTLFDSNLCLISIIRSKANFGYSLNLVHFH